MVRLFKNVVVVDGSGKDAFGADVLVRDDTIMAVGSFPSYKADEVIYGNGAYLTPGFVDPHINSDKYLTLFSSPSARDFLLQGVTSGIMGHCGFSLAPLLYNEVLSSHVRWNKHALNINWSRLKDFISTFNEMGVAMNMGTLIGHSVLRDSIVHNPDVFRKLSANELRVFRSLLSDAFDEGALGISFGLGYRPYDDTSYYEVRALCEMAGRKKRACGVHLRNEKEGVVNSVQEVLRLARDTSAQMVVSHFRPFIGFEDSFLKALSHIEEGFEKQKVYVDVNPFPHSSVGIGEILPSDLYDGDEAAFVNMLDDKKFAKKIERLFPSINPETTYIVSVPHMEFLNGIPLYNFAKERELSTSAALVELMRISRLKAVILYENLSQSRIDELLFKPFSLIASNSPHIDMLRMHKPPRAYATFTSYLMEAEKRGVRFEDAISKITALPAEVYKLTKRGRIASGARADLVLLSKDMSVEEVYVNGVCRVKDGSFQEGEGSGESLLPS